MPEDEGKAKQTPVASATDTGATVVNDGSLVYVDYIAKTKDDGKIFDLTIEEVAKKEGLFKENDRYEPMLVAVGWKWLLPALEEQLVGMRVGESRTVEITPEKAAGTRDPKKVKLVPRAKVVKQGVRPAKGGQVRLGNEQGIIIADLGRQLRVDFNPPLAGKTLLFDVTVKRILHEQVEKILAIVKRRIPAVPTDKYNVIADKEIVTIEIPKETRYIEGVQYAEIGIAADVLKLDQSLKQVKFIVTYERPKENTTQ